MTAPTIEIRGIGFPNKGAELMLDACVDFIGDRFLRSRATVIPRGPRDYANDQLRQRHLVPRLHFPRRRRFMHRVLAWVPAAMRNGDAYTIGGDEDIILDASGFAYGDTWGERKLADRAAVQALALRRNPALKIVFLPQAFGPFSHPGVALHARELLAPAGLIYARDEESRSHLESIGVADGRVRIVPDFTNLVSPDAASTVMPEPGTIGLIPNEKLAGQSGYFALFAQVADALRSQGNKVAFILHEGTRDEATIEAIVQQMVSGAPPILRPATARGVKACIGGCTLVVGSRFHGLVSALNQGVPAVGIGWSHKYRALFEDYGLEGFACEFPIGADWVLSRVAQLQSSDLAAIEQRLESVNGRNLHAVQEMWNDVERYCAG